MRHAGQQYLKASKIGPLIVCVYNVMQAILSQAKKLKMSLATLVNVRDITLLYSRQIIMITCMDEKVAANSDI